MILFSYKERVIIISVYVMSDLHGCYDKYKKMLQKIKFCDEDTLYVLGDVVDRGEGGIKILQDMMKYKNIIPIRGNHDFMAYTIFKMQNQVSSYYNEDRYSTLFQNWIYDGGQVTFDAFNKLNLKDQQEIIAYLKIFIICDEIEIKNKKFFLSHTVPEKARFLKFDSLEWQALIIGEPEYEKKYFDNKFIVTGHTPTGFIDKNYKGKIYKKNNHIAVDCGAVFGNPLGCICLDNSEEFYVE